MLTFFFFLSPPFSLRRRRGARPGRGALVEAAAGWCRGRLARYQRAGLQCDGSARHAADDDAFGRRATPGAQRIWRRAPTARLHVWWYVRVVVGGGESLAACRFEEPNASTNLTFLRFFFFSHRCFATAGYDASRLGPTPARYDASRLGPPTTLGLGCGSRRRPPSPRLFL